ncbi:hypothetical protein [Nocardia wallacei]|uniref:hypothetical protein n=1 Tax=Nocardia wallacei TaxID=480035 RepID=UPI0024563351|nr:hypothetical protein [Nocardia wallacei]
MESIDQQRSGAAEAWGKFRALGGVQHLIDGAAPAIAFLVGYATVNAEIGVLHKVVGVQGKVLWMPRAAGCG